MPRIARNKYNTNFFHIMVQGINKEYIFNTEIYMKKYEKLMKTYLKNFDLKLVAYCIMNNHAHMLIYAEESNEMSNFMKCVNTSFAMYYNKQKNRVGVVFRNRYESEPIYNLKYLINCIAYIHNNPVKAGMVETANQYRYSSYNDYLRGLIDSEIIRFVFGCTTGYIETFKKIHKNYDVENFIDFDELDYNQKIESVLKENETSVFLNEKKFNKMVKKMIIDYKIPIKVICEKFNMSRYKISKILKEKKDCP